MPLCAFKHGADPEVRLAIGVDVDALRARGLELDRGHGVKGIVLAVVCVRGIVEIGHELARPV